MSTRLSKEISACTHLALHTASVQFVVLRLFRKKTHKSSTILKFSVIICTMITFISAFAWTLLAVKLATASINTTVECVALAHSSTVCAYQETSSEAYMQTSFSTRSIFVNGLTSGMKVSLTQVITDNGSQQFQDTLKSIYVSAHDTGFAAEVLFEGGKCLAQIWLGGEAAGICSGCEVCALQDYVVSVDCGNLMNGISTDCQSVLPIFYPLNGTQPAVTALPTIAPTLSASPTKTPAPTTEPTMLPTKHWYD